ncbi:hypothetical protein ACFSHR_13145 [Azotobacter chroococcum]
MLVMAILGMLAVTVSWRCRSRPSNAWKARRAA